MRRSLARLRGKIREKFVLFIESLTVIGLFGAILRTVGWGVTKKCRRVDLLRERALYKYCYLKWREFVLGNLSCTLEVSRKKEDIIWHCWWQGLEVAPTTVLECHKRLKDLNLDKKIIVIDKNNYLDYVEIPDYIVKAANDGQLKLAHVCDILRFGLLYRYGGLWIDADAYLNTALTEYFSFDLVSVRYLEKGEYRSRGRWVGFFFGGKAGTLFFGVMYELLIKLHHSCGAGIEYLVMDYLIEVIYDNNKSIAESFSRFPFIDYDLHEMQRLIVKEDFASVIKKSNPINKLTWKADRSNSKFFKTQGNRMSSG